MLQVNVVKELISRDTETPYSFKFRLCISAPDTEKVLTEYS